MILHHVMPSAVINDFVRYSAIQEELRELRALGRIVEANGELNPEFGALWRESEAIKNRHGGMPPEEGNHD